MEDAQVADGARLCIPITLFVAPAVVSVYATGYDRHATMVLNASQLNRQTETALTPRTVKARYEMATQATLPLQ